MKSLKAKKEILDYLLVDNQSVLQAKRAWRMNAYANHKDIFYEYIPWDCTNKPPSPSYFLPLTCFDKFESEILLDEKGFTWPNPKPLWNEQIEIMKLVREEMRVSNCCIIAAVTGFWKTRVMIELLRASKWKRCLILMPTLILIKQTSVELTNFDIKHTIYWWESKTISWITIMSVQWFRNMSENTIDKLWFDVVFIDECHKFLW